MRKRVTRRRCSRSLRVYGGVLFLTLSSLEQFRFRESLRTCFLLCCFPPFFLSSALACDLLSLITVLEYKGSDAPITGTFWDEALFLPEGSRIDDFSQFPFSQHLLTWRNLLKM